jgi:hypothetical protein
MARKIDKKISKAFVVDPGEDSSKAAELLPAESLDNVVHMHEKLQRPPVLSGSTYKIKTPLSEHALYVTFNDIVLNPDTEHELRRPFEMFINSKTRIASAVFRKGGDVTFLVEELRSVFDPQGGYFKKGGKFMPSLVAEIGDVLEHHLCEIGILKSATLDEHQENFIKSKTEEFNQQTADPEEQTDDFPQGTTLCKKCLTRAMIMLDGCLTCLNCGESKCS